MVITFHVLKIFLSFLLMSLIIIRYIRTPGKKRHRVLSIILFFIALFLYLIFTMDLTY